MTIPPLPNLVKPKNFVVIVERIEVVIECLFLSLYIAADEKVSFALKFVLQIYVRIESYFSAV